MNPINSILNFFSSVTAGVATFFIAPKLYQLTKSFITEYIALNAGADLINIGLMAWALACGLLTYAVLQLLLFMFTASWVARHD